MTQKPALPPRRVVPPPPPLPRPSSSSTTTDVPDNASEENVGIAARIARLKLNELGRNPTVENGPEVRPSKYVAPRRAIPPPPPPAEVVAKVPSPEPGHVEQPEVTEEIRDTGPSTDQLERLLARKLPPPPPRRIEFLEAQYDNPPPPPPPRRRLPPKPSRLPTPPPEPELAPTVASNSHPRPETCLKCRDLAFVDVHAGQFPRLEVVSLDSLAYDLCEPFDNETDRVRAIFTWLHHNISYDCESFFSGNLQAASPDDVLRSGLAVCDGYAGLFKALADLVGIECYRVAGHGKGYGHTALEQNAPVPPFQGNHAWNCVQMDGEWHLIDACWGAGSIENGVFNKKLDPSWFSSTPLEFSQKHFPEDPSFQLVSEEYGQPMSWEDYILAEEGPTIFNDYRSLSLHPYLILPSSKYLRRQQQVVFTVFKFCEHMSTEESDNFVFIISLPDNRIRIPLQRNSEGGFSAEVTIPASRGDVSLYTVTTVDHKDAMGIGVKKFMKANGKKAMTFGGLARWTIV